MIGNGVIDAENARAALDRMEIDSLGLDSIDRLLLTAMIRNYNGGPVGLETIAAAIGEEAVTIEDVYEPYLMQIGFLSRTPRGRIVTPAGYRHLALICRGSKSWIYKGVEKIQWKAAHCARNPHHFWRCYSQWEDFSVQTARAALPTAN